MTDRKSVRHKAQTAFLSARDRIVARINPARTRQMAQEILDDPVSTPTNREIAHRALDLADWADSLTPSESDPETGAKH